MSVKSFSAVTASLLTCFEDDAALDGIEVQYQVLGVRRDIRGENGVSDGLFRPGHDQGGSRGEQSRRAFESPSGDRPSGPQAVQGAGEQAEGGPNQTGGDAAVDGAEKAAADEPAEQTDR